MPFELSSSFDYVTGGIINHRFFSNPIWIALLITILIMIIIPLSDSSLMFMRGFYIFIGTTAILFVYNSAIIKKYTITKETQGAAEIVGDLTYINNLDGVQVEPLLIP